ncbi:CoB--CoM heterodisulfide reductase iron-sulfur subunit B family protein [Desulfobacca acetoxidans]|uniref:CoB--CoM heterodisulfide reductase n=1 Tax=Desulfobacca acetoxidans (strain ATCC 700848 / DSM 11109 / ASRB2) TaxID=880072 RepID=F2NGD7_DESAR|nr:CoB--CoM heterodisulfide reductase iron-sulfur subunit B family protein [Desulfobacca acetoxidans]AEB08550.1 CoB--CoM heterodisulfide reductase [Desulfobacca acetoxidans DSM 11109]
MKVSYYPGCSLEHSARDYEESIEAVAGLLDVQLEEIPDWNCCGATAAHSLNKYLSLALPARNLVHAEGIGQDVVVPCALCFNRLKAAEHALLGPEQASLGMDYQGTIRVWDLLDFLTQEAILDQIRDRIAKPLKGLQTVCYYGCMVARPPKITSSRNCENPTNMDRLVKTLGADPYPWSYKTDCCGAGFTISRPDIIDTLVKRLYDRALEAGAECFVVSCQMCQANLDISQERIARNTGQNYYLPVLYFTELIGLALGHPDVQTWLSRHFVDPLPLLQDKGLI